MAKKEKEVKKDKKSFFKSVKGELKKVIWLTPKQLVNNTVAVLSIVVIIAAIVFVLDFAFKAMNTYGIDKIKEKVSNIVTSSENTETNVVEDSNSGEEENNSEITEENSEENQNAEEVQLNEDNQETITQTEETSNNSVEQ